MVKKTNKGTPAPDALGSVNRNTDWRYTNEDTARALHGAAKQILLNVKCEECGCECAGCVSGAETNDYSGCKSYEVCKRS
jgi:hypothetical protein